MSKGHTIVRYLSHAVVVNERGSHDEHVEYLMTLKLQQQQRQQQQLDCQATHNAKAVHGSCCGRLRYLQQWLQCEKIAIVLAAASSNKALW